MRGKWVMEVLLGSPPPPPPPNVPALEETNAAANGKLLSVRERMEEHRKNPACTSCHRVIDPLGLALENFDVTGKWRIKDNGVPIDATGELYDGTKIDGPASLRDALLKHKDAVLLSFTENLMTYALGRRVEPPTCRPCAASSATRRGRTTGCRRSCWASRSAAFQSSSRRLRHAPRQSRQTEGSRMFITQEAPVAPDGAEGHGRDRRAAAARRDGAGGDGVGAAPREPQGRGWWRSRWCTASAGSTAFGMQKNLWSPAAVGADFDLTPSALSPLEPYRDVPDHRQQHRRAERRGVHGAGDRRRSLPLGRGVPDAGASAADAGLRSPGGHLARSDLRAEGRRRRRRSRRCSCASRTSIRPAAASTATRAPTPTRSAGRRRPSRCRWCAIRALVFDQLFGVGATPEARAARRKRDRSILDWVTESVNQLKTNLGAADRARLSDYLDDVREIERRIQKVEAFNRSGEQREHAGRAGRRARLLQRARQADVRSAGDRVHLGHHARLRRSR